ncbi:MAG: hypothetical protein HONDAALG_01513 [Gammaproteobacteria bacterium]|nr:hypothetical protein [Gammaproteobacteria bacterium]
MKQGNHTARLLIVISLGVFLVGCTSATGFRRGSVSPAAYDQNVYGLGYDFKHAPQPF